MSLKLLLLVIGLAALTLLGSGLLGRRFNVPTGVRLLTETGTIFILVGALVGPRGLGILSTHYLEQLAPVLIISYGWIGFLYGTHFEWRRMRRFPAFWYGGALTESLSTLLIVSGIAWFTMPLIADLTPMLRGAMALVLGICAAGTAPSGVFLLSTRREISPFDVRALKFFSAIDDLPAVLLLGILFAILYPTEGMLPLAGLGRIALSICEGVLVGAITHFILPTTNERHGQLILLGMASLAAGSAVMLKLSPIFVSVIAGMIFANLSPRKESVYGLMARREHTLYTVFLLLGGAMFRVEAGRALLALVPGYVLARALAKLLGAYLARTIFLRQTRVSAGLGAGLLFQGGISLVIAVNFETSHGPSVSHLFMTTFVVAVLINDLIGPRVATAVLGRRRARARR